MTLRSGPSTEVPAPRVLAFKKALLRYAEGAMVSSTVCSLHFNRPETERCIDQAMQFGPLAAVEPANLAPEHITAG
ncbi:hypothetical protein [Aquisalimonas sp.]|uniref:hypothetical protein n=1 Tax=Aquisalimonas sp. TaxID=1872621 RepID=UPI0025C5E349|nr:hypothetical protein [Aquisalimonas sp.]